MSIIGWLWNLLPWYIQLGGIAFVCLSLIGIAFNIGRIVYAVSGKWGLAGLGILMASIAAFVASIVGRIRRDDPIEHLPEDHKDAKPSFGTNRAKRTIRTNRTAKRFPVKPYEPPKGLT